MVRRNGKGCNFLYKFENKRNFSIFLVNVENYVNFSLGPLYFRGNAT